MPGLIHILPAEILERIFLEIVTTTHMFRSRHRLNPISLSRVCKSWRNLIINRRSLWSHLDLPANPWNTKPTYPCPKLWSQRSRGALLHIRIFEAENFDSDESSVESDTDRDSYARKKFVNLELTPWSVVSALVSFLVPLKSQVHTLELHVLSPWRHLISSIGHLAPTGNDPSPLKVLKVTAETSDEILRFRIIAPRRSPDNLPQPSYNLRRFLASLDVLSLVGAYFPWEFTPLSSLVELRIQGGNAYFSISLPSLSIALSSCPGIRLIVFSQVDLKDGSTDGVAYSVTLPELRTLVLRDVMEDEGLAPLLSIISPGQHPLQMSIDCRKAFVSIELIKALRLFFDRSRLVVLHSRSKSSVMWFGSQLNAFPYLHTLSMESYTFVDGTICDSEPYPDLTEPSKVLWPRLRNLYLNRCAIDSGSLLRLANQHSSLQNLHLLGCHQHNVCLSGPSDRFGRECVSLLSEIVPNVVWSNYSDLCDPTSWSIYRDD